MVALGRVLQNLLNKGARQEALAMLQSSSLPFPHLADVLIKDVVPGHYGWAISYLQQLPKPGKQEKQRVVMQLCTERIKYLTRMQCNAGIVAAGSAALYVSSFSLSSNGFFLVCLPACGFLLSSLTAISLDVDLCALKTCREALLKKHLVRSRGQQRRKRSLQSGRSAQRIAQHDGD